MLKHLLDNALKACYPSLQLDGETALLNSTPRVALRPESHCAGLYYQSPVALRLAHYIDQPPEQIAKCLVGRILATCEIASYAPTSTSNGETPVDSALPSWLKAAVSSHVQTQGWIGLQITAAGVASWLQHCVSGVLAMGNAPEKARSTQDYLVERCLEFEPIHAHARCCSILQLATVHDIIALGASKKNDSHWQSYGFRPLVSPSPVPWLNQGRLRFIDQAEALLLQVIQASDRLDQALDQQINLGAATNFETSIKRDIHQLHRLGRAFQAFHAHCRPLEIIANPSGSLPDAQANLGLIHITQQVLACLLCRLQVEPPVSL